MFLEWRTGAEGFKRRMLNNLSLQCQPPSMKAFGIFLGLSVGENSEKTQLTPLLSSGSLVVRFLFVDDIFSVYCLEPLYVLLTLFFTRYSLLMLASYCSFWRYSYRFLSVFCFVSSSLSPFPNSLAPFTSCFLSMLFPRKSSDQNLEIEFFIPGDVA